VRQMDTTLELLHCHYNDLYSGNLRPTHIIFGTSAWKEFQSLIRDQDPKGVPAYGCPYLFGTAECHVSDSIPINSVEFLNVYRYGDERFNRRVPIICGSQNGGSQDSYVS
jgi:hypothetical protein